MRKVFIVGGGAGGYNDLYRRMGFDIVKTLGEADVVQFTGGADVSPELYGAKAHQFTGNDRRRDAYEMDVFNQCVSDGIPMVGICRGGQFLNVMNGGEMYQHVERHTASHFITDLQTGEEVYVSSTHHQMMKPSPKALLVASSTLGGTREWYEGEMFKKDVSNQDIEVVYYEETNSLCFQPHPEFRDDAFDGMFNYFESLLARFTFKSHTQFACSC